jgi:hypothetical protein
VLSLKQPLFFHLRQLMGSNSDDLIDMMWTVTVLMDKLALLSTENYQRGREEIIKRQQQELLELSTWAVRQLPDHIIVMVADGLGHGPYAAEASQAAVEVFNKSVTRAATAGQLISYIHSALKNTRGAVVAVAEALLESRTVHYAGVGNISGLIIHPAATRHMVSLNGTAGVEVRKILEFTYPWRKMLCWSCIRMD